MNAPQRDAAHMSRALELAALGRGAVEPNPMVGCVIVRDGQVLGEGWHQQHGGPHAEIHALAAAGATVYVTLEPCCHWGQTPPCTQALIAAGVRRVVAAMLDPFAAVQGKGIAELEAAGIHVELGLMQAEAEQLNAPYLKLLRTRKPWVIAKWAMTLDGKIATAGGNSRWISGEASRAVVHALRGRVDAILVGRSTALVDDPRLTARPPGPRVATRIVLDSRASLSSESQLVRTARDIPLIIAAQEAAAVDRERLTKAGAEVLMLAGDSPAARLEELLQELGRRRMTNLLVEGGGQVLGSFFDAGQIDEVQAFISTRLVGGAAAPSPIAGIGRRLMSQAVQLEEPRMEVLDQDIYIHGRVRDRTGPPDEPRMEQTDP